MKPLASKAPGQGFVWLLVAGYFIATSLGHLSFTLWLLKSRQVFSFGFSFKTLVVPLMLAAGAAIAAWLVFQAVRRPATFRAVAAHWLLWGACIALVDRFLTYSVYEYAHYPQYALMAWLVARALDPDRRRGCTGQVLLWTTLLGMLDELMQYLWITPSYGNYLDFNDFLVNMLAAAAGVMLYYGDSDSVARLARPRPIPWARVTAAGGIVLACGAALFASGLLVLAPPEGVTVPPGGWLALPDGRSSLYLQRGSAWYHSWQVGPYRGTYFVLPPWAAICLMLGVAGLFHAFPRMLPMPSPVANRPPLTF